MVFYQIHNLFQHKIRFRLVVAHTAVGNFYAVFLIRPQLFSHSSDVVCYDFIRCFQNVAAAAVIAFQLINAAVGIVLFEVENVPHVRSAPTVNTLVVVADDKDISVFAHQHFNEQKLYFVRILELVHVHV